MSKTDTYDLGDNIVLIVTINDEGVVFDIWDEGMDECIATEGRTFEEWAEFTAECEGIRWNKRGT